MNRLLLPVIGTLFLCAQSFAALAATSTSTSTASTNPSGQQQREQIEAKRDQISGTAKLSKTAKKGSVAIQDTPVVTDDAPAQVQQK